MRSDFLIANRLTLLFIVLLFLTDNTNSQILHTESFAVILDTTKTFKGSVIPDFEFQNQKEDLIEFENNANLSFRFKNHGFTIANKIEMSTYDDETILSGGYLYLEYRRLLDKRLLIEPFSQFHWTEARGLDFKYAGGINARLRMIFTEKIGLFAGIGPFYEFERWNYDGVADELLPLDATYKEAQNIKLGSYLSFKWFTDYNFDIDISLYHQSRFDELHSTPRLASSSSISYNFTEHIGLIFMYQNIYDYKLVVPIKKLFNNVIFTIEVSF